VSATTGIWRDDPAACAPGKFRVKMERLGIVRKRAKDQIVGFRDRARDRVLEYSPDFKFFEIKSGHLANAPLSSIERSRDRPAARSE
jgi:hypothetical protein